MINPSGGCLRALVLDEEEEYEAYIAAATMNIQADASDYASRNNRGVAYFEMGEMSAALDDFTAACNLAPHESSPLPNRAGILEDIGDLQGALASATKAIYVAPTDSTCYFVRAGIYQKLGDKTHAEEDRQSGNRCRIVEGRNIVE